jgi:hypothetical protein
MLGSNWQRKEIVGWQKDRGLNKFMNKGRILMIAKASKGPINSKTSNFS